MNLMKLGLSVASATVLAAVVWISDTGVVSATMPIQKKAKELGYPVQSCLYCHGEKLPKKGAATHNDRGKWLIAEKQKRNAKEVDPAWLKDSTDPKK